MQQSAVKIQDEEQMPKQNS